MCLTAPLRFLGLLLLLLLGAAPAWVQPPAPRPCAETPAVCDKELVLLKQEVDEKRRLLAAVWDVNDQLQQRAAQAEARRKALEAAPTPPAAAAPDITEKGDE